MTVYYDGQLDLALDRDLEAVAKKHGWTWVGQGKDLRPHDGKRDIRFVKKG